MKKLLYPAVATMLAITLLAVSGEAKVKKNISKNKIVALVEELQADAAAFNVNSERETISLPGIKVVTDNNLDYVSIGGVGLNLIKLKAKYSDDDEDSRLAMAALQGLEKMIVLSYDDCNDALKAKFNKKIAAVLNDCELLMEAKEDDEIVRFYGELSPDGKKVKNVVMFAPGDDALVCFFGTFDSSKLADMAASMD